MLNDFISKFSKIIPPSMRSFLRRHISFADYDLHIRELSNPYVNESQNCDFPGSPYTLGIIKEFAQYHKSNIAACKELGVSYRVIDISDSDWIHVVKDANCDAFLVWPSSYLSIWKEMFDDRLKIMEDDLGMLIYPSYKEMWLYENKRRVRDWLEINQIPHPKTWIFYDENEAIDFLENTEFPIVFKTNVGSSASGVWILRGQADAIKLVRKAFRQGIVAKGRDPRDRQWGAVYLQEYFPDVKEYRMIRINDSYFGYQKEQIGDFHSGSHAFSFFDPPRALLDLTYEITQKGKFTSMDIDIFETQDGRLLVNELQTVFGIITIPPVMLMVNGKIGRYYREQVNGEWIFEEGDFSRNACSNLRVEYLLHNLIPAFKEKH